MLELLMLINLQLSKHHSMQNKLFSNQFQGWLNKLQKHQLKFNILNKHHRSQKRLFKSQEKFNMLIKLLKKQFLKSKFKKKSWKQKELLKGQKELKGQIQISLGLIRQLKFQLKGLQKFKDLQDILSMKLKFQSIKLNKYMFLSMFIMKKPLSIMMKLKLMHYNHDYNL